MLPRHCRAQQATITPNYKDADIRQVIEAVGEVTGKNFILDPRVKAQVTMLSSAPMSPDAFYEAFLSILSVYGFVAVPAGDVIKILPDANARQVPGAENEPGGGRPDDIVTRVITVQNVAAAQLVPILRPLIPQYGHLAAHPPSNLLIISDRASNVDRMVRIVARIDQAADQDYEVIRLEHASASEIVKIVAALNQGGQQAEGGGGPAITVVADERTNSVLRDRRQDRPPPLPGADHPPGHAARGRRRHPGALPALHGCRGPGHQAAEPVLGQRLRQAAAAARMRRPPAQRGEVSIWADESTNALIITAPPKTMKSMMAVIDKLDIRRAQVHGRGHHRRGLVRQGRRTRRHLGDRRRGSRQRRRPDQVRQHHRRRRHRRRHPRRRRTAAPARRRHAAAAAPDRQRPDHGRGQAGRLPA